MANREVTRRSVLAVGVAASAGIAFPPRSIHGAPKRATKRRLLFNCDGSVIHCWGNTVFPQSKGPLTRKQFTSLVFTPIENSGVDAVLFSFGSGNIAEYQSNVLEWPGEADGFKFPAGRSWHGGVEVDAKNQYLNPKSLADAGHNPPKVIVEECHRRGMAAFVSLRMNDTHDGQHPKDQFPNPELPTFKRHNPDWLLQDLHRWSALDYRKPQVRRLKLRVIEEFFDRWDFDGIELDWLRHTMYFPRGTEQKNAKYLTDFVRAVRKSLNDRAARRGRKIEIAVRIPERLSWCKLGGFDVPSWIEEDLFDTLILGQGLTESVGIDGFRRLMKKRELPVYPCLAPYGNGYPISPDEVIRGNAANLWRDGADGIYAFNWFNHGTWRKKLLSQISDPGSLKNKNKHYALVRRFDADRHAGSDHLRFNTAYRDAHVPAELKTSAGPHVLQLPVAEKPQQAELWIALEHARPGDAITAKLNGHDLQLMKSEAEGSLSKVGYTLAIPPNQGMIGLPFKKSLDMRFQALRWSVPVNAIVTGRNQLSLQLTSRGGGSDKPLRVTRVELAAGATRSSP